MKKLLEMLIASTALAGDEIYLEELGSYIVRGLTLDDLNRLQGQVGDLHQTCRQLLEKIRYAQGDDQ
jgi:hypothetical protein